jgi:hypothetical protein
MVRDREKERGRDRDRDKYDDARERDHYHESKRTRRNSPERDHNDYDVRERETCSRTSSDTSRNKISDKPARKKASELIPGYDSMTPSEKVKARMNLQLFKVASKDEDLKPTTPVSDVSVSPDPSKQQTEARGWERWRFDKTAPVVTQNDDDAPLDETEAEIQAARYKMQSNTAPSKTDLSHEDAIFGRYTGFSQTYPSSTQKSNKQEKHEDVSPMQGNKHGSPSLEKRVEGTSSNNIEQNALINSKIMVQQRNRQNEWLRRVDAMRSARSGTGQPSEQHVPQPPLQPQQLQPLPPTTTRESVSFQFTNKFTK